ncbi:tail protein X [Amorphus orientalis]|uniref:Phage tail protein X n=1 Tax=Amorphus orientalis TaxID=649198 RepID=A0AAE4ASB9_9HYPH|nr:tail protein X [Amorphus orientalis]MDQ0314865.1 phage tail protein X [Amorphus orientalis]
MPEERTVRGEGITLDLLLWRRDGVRGRELVEAALDLNPGLADLGAVLPLGTVVFLPDPPAARSAPVPRKVVDLFG